MRGHQGGFVVASAGALVIAFLTAGCESKQEREWDVASNWDASADDIIDAGHATDIATKPRQMVVTWEVEPEDDEGPAQGAWRLYDRSRGAIAEGKFGTVREASARIDAIPVRGGFFLTDYAKHTRMFLNRDGDLSASAVTKAPAGSSLKGGVLVDSVDEDAGKPWTVVIPNKRSVVPLSTFPEPNLQDIELTSDGTVWVLLPWTSERGPFRVAYAKDGKPPWTTETIPLPPGTGASSDALSASGNRLFVVGGHEKGDRMTVDTILTREAGSTTGWTTVSAKGIADNLTVTPKIDVLRNRLLVAQSGGEGDWVQQKDGTFTAIHPPRTHRHSEPAVSVEGRWLWASERPFGNSLQYSNDAGRTWDEFDR